MRVSLCVLADLRKLEALADLRKLQASVTSLDPWRSGEGRKKLDLLLVLQNKKDGKGEEMEMGMVVVAGRGKWGHDSHAYHGEN
jgi:hypothetical protein